MTQPTPQTTDTPVAELGAIGAVLAAAEATIAALMLKAYTEFLAKVLAVVLVSGADYPNPAAIWSLVPYWESKIDLLMDALVKLARAGWIEATRQLGVDVPFSPDDPILADQLNRTRNLMVRTPDEVYRLIVHQLGMGVDAGETRAQLAARVRRVLDVSGSENWPARAKTVAVTEVHRAWNFGALAGALRAQQKVGQVRKTWHAKDDSATRPGHKRADGQTVFINQPFIVNMEALMAPGDPSGSPSNVINCRCKPSFRRTR